MLYRLEIIRCRMNKFQGRTRRLSLNGLKFREAYRLHVLASIRRYPLHLPPHEIHTCRCPYLHHQQTHARVRLHYCIPMGRAHAEGIQRRDTRCSARVSPARTREFEACRGAYPAWARLVRQVRVGVWKSVGRAGSGWSGSHTAMERPSAGLRPRERVGEMEFCERGEEDVAELWIRV